MHLLSILSFALCYSVNAGIAQSNNIGSPPIKNFSKKTYRAGTQNWKITQGQNGVVYVANNEGLLKFDGNHWRRYPLPNGTILRSFAIANDCRIYAGGQGEIGYFEGDEKGELTFRSLVQFLPEEYRIFADVWQIMVDSGGVYFMTRKMIAKWNGEEMQIPISEEGFAFLDKIDKRFYIQKDNGDLIYCENQFTAPFKEVANFPGKITSMFAHSADSLFLTTENGNIYLLSETSVAPWPIPDDPFFKNNVIYSSDILPNGNVVLGSTSAGMAIIDRNWRIQQQISKANNLQNNTVLSVYANDNGNIWLGLDNGITFVQASSALTDLFPDGDLEGTCYSAAIHNDHLYAAANTGIYRIPWKPYYRSNEKTAFTKVSNSGGQVWSLGLHRGMLLAGHQKGALKIENDQALQISDVVGVWRFLPVADDFLIAGHYGGLALFEQKDNELTFLGNMEGLEESCRLLASENGLVWMAHPYRGIFKNELNLEDRKVHSTYFNAQNGLPSDFNNRLFQIRNKTVFVGEKGVFKYDEHQQQLVPDEGFNKIFGAGTQVKYLHQDINGNIWYAAGKEAGVLWIKDLGIDKSIEKMIIPELADKLVTNFEFILTIDEQNVLIAAEKGMIHFDPTKYKPDGNQTEIVLSEVWLKGQKDSLLYGGHWNKAFKIPEPVLGYKQNALEFVFSSTNHEEQEFVKYASRLEGLEESWTPWNNNTTLNLNNLRPGKYTLFLKAKNKAGLESKPIEFSFKILPPWYASTLAYSFYGFFLLVFFILKDDRTDKCSDQ
ncbi:MAG: triple tyrosine motif-containing protein [Bacteroidota bacterium]